MALSLRKLREDGYHAEIVEHYFHHSRTTHDLWTFADILAIRPNEVLACQTTSSSNMASRVKKILAADTFPMVREAGIKVVCHGWKKSDGRWVAREKFLA